MSAPPLTHTLRTQACSISFDQVSKSFPSRHGQSTILENVTFTVEPGEIVSIIGSSGCGKSTLLRAAAGLGRATAGSVRIDGDIVTGLDDRVAIGFQEPRLLPWRTVEKNVALGLPRGTAQVEGQETIGKLLELVGLAAYKDHRPREISGGMAQRASLARALARAPGVLLLDEPFGALDALTRINMQDLLLDVHYQDPTTILLVTHDVDEALYLSDRIIVLGKADENTPAAITEVVEVPGGRPRERSDTRLTQLRHQLLAELGVDTH
ncbi:ABC transporter ATP-binding protein [Rothia sp. LK2588]|uniref:ABC transporter ATP-binding protein n=1 Tax=Rothia sp. LK2588 TaxID=3114369 RepID=UPI0034CD730F